MVVEFEKQGRTAIITLNRPEARNAVKATHNVDIGVDNSHGGGGASQC